MGTLIDGSRPKEVLVDRNDDSWGAYSKSLGISILQSWALLIVILVAGGGAIALLYYIRSEGVLVPVLVALAGAAVLLLFGYLRWRPLVRFGYILMWVGVWLALTSLVLRLFAFGQLIGVLGSALWMLASAFGVFAWYDQRGY